MNAPKRAYNATALFESLAAVRDAERKLVQAQHDPDLYYESLTICPADRDIVTDLKHAYKAIDGRIYHNKECWEVDVMADTLINAMEKSDAAN